MQLFSSHDSLLWLLKKFADKLVEIETSITTWQQDDRIRANILAEDGWATNSACLTIIVNVQTMNSALHVVTSKEPMEVKYLMSQGMGMSSYEWLDVLNARKEADGSRVEHQLRGTAQGTCGGPEDGSRILARSSLASPAVRGTGSPSPHFPRVLHRFPPRGLGRRLHDAGSRIGLRP